MWLLSRPPRRSSLVVWLSVLAAAVVSASVPASAVSVERTVKLDRAVVTISERWRFRESLHESLPNGFFHAAVPTNLWDCCIGAAWVEVDGRTRFNLVRDSLRTEEKSNEQSIEEDQTGGEGEITGVTWLKADLTAASVAASRILSVRYDLGKQLRPVPAAVAFTAPQTVVFEDKYPYTLSQYPIETQRTTYVFDPSAKIIETTVRQSTSPLLHFVEERSAGNLKLIGEEVSFDFGKGVLERGSENLKKHENSVTIRFTFQRPLPRVTEAVRNVVLSHHRAVSFKDRLWLVNDAARSTGGYNRWEISALLGGTLVHSRQKASPHRTLFSLDCGLPADAWDFQYFDQTGNISTSGLRPVKDAATAYRRVYLEPRYPLLGGVSVDWNTEFRTPIKSLIMSPNHALSEADSNGSKTNEYSVALPASPLCFDTFAENYTVSVALPPGASLKSYKLPGELKSAEPRTSTLHSWFGVLRPRTVLSFDFRPKAVSDENLATLFEPIILTYQYSQFWDTVKCVSVYSGITAVFFASFYLMVLAS